MVIDTSELIAILQDEPERAETARTWTKKAKMRTAAASEHVCHG